MIRLVDAATGAPIGTLTDEQLQDLIDVLEEEREGDRDYYITQATVDMLEERGADDDLINPAPSGPGRQGRDGHPVGARVKLRLAAVTIVGSAFWPTFRAPRATDPRVVQ